MVMERLQEPHTKLFLDNLNKVHGEWNSHAKFDELYDRLEQAIVRLSQANPDGAWEVSLFHSSSVMMVWEVAPEGRSRIVF